MGTPRVCDAVLEVSGIKSHLAPDAHHLAWGRGLEGGIILTVVEKKNKNKMKLCLMLDAGNWCDQLSSESQRLLRSKVVGSPWRD